MPDRPDRSRNPYVFVVGCPRSGTTLLQRMLDSHPLLCVANDTHFITRAAKKELRRNPVPALTTELVESVRSYRRFYRMGLDDGAIDVAKAGCHSYAAFVSRLYDLRGKKTKKPLSGEKTPDYCRQMPLLHGLFPAARFVHIVRDGRNTALSALDWATPAKGPGRWPLWQEDRLGTCALWWRWQAGTGTRDGRALGDRCYHQVLYEDLVEDPEKTLRGITDFLCIPYSDKMADYHVGKTRRAPGLSAKSAWLPPVRNLRDWRQNMSRTDVEVFTGIAGPLLREFGFECGSGPLSEVARIRVERCLHWWDEHAKS